MKSRISSLFLFFCLFMVTSVYSHNEVVHQFIVREAFQLLRQDFPTQLTEMENYVGTDQTVNQGHFWTFGDGVIVSGAYMEDHFDIN